VKVYCIGDETTVRGFRLAGIEGRAVRTPDQAATALADAAAHSEVGLVILTGRFSHAIRRQVDAIRGEHDRPLIVEIAGPDGVSPGEEGLRRMVQAAVGTGIGR
jgi:vacuolar-type H+-ATPase subunit F/Vma7